MANKTSFDRIMDYITIYKFRWIIIGVIIVVAIFCLIAHHNLDKEYQNYGYSGYNDNVVYDEWTGNIVPKYMSDSHSDSDDFIINDKGNKITVAQIEEQINAYKNVQDSKMFITEENKNLLIPICDILLKEYLDANYEVVKVNMKSSANFYNFKIQGKYYVKSNCEFSSTEQLREIVKNIFREKLV